MKLWKKIILVVLALLGVSGYYLYRQVGKAVKEAVAEAMGDISKSVKLNSDCSFN